MCPQLPVEVDFDIELSGLNFEQRRRAGEEGGVGTEIVNSQRSTHDDDLERLDGLAAADHLPSVRSGTCTFA